MYELHINTSLNNIKSNAYHKLLNVFYANFENGDN